MVLSDLTDLVAAADPAGSRRGEHLKRSGARMTAIVIGQDAYRRVFVLHAWAARTTTEAFMDHLLAVNRQWRPKQFGIEANAMQVLFGDAVLRLARSLGETFPLVPIWQPTNVSKEWRMRTHIQPVLADGRLFLQPQHHELRAEMQACPNGSTVDLVDVLAMALSLLPERTAPQVVTDECAALAEYLRNTGAAPEVIEARIAEVRAASLPTAPPI